MFNIGWAEFLVLVLVFFIFIKPKDIPSVLKSFVKIFHKIRNIWSNFYDEINQSFYAKELKKRNKEILQIEAEIKRMNRKNFANNKKNKRN